jgi:tRNA-intron endonuclease
MIEGILDKDMVILPLNFYTRDFYEKGWYGEVKDKNLVLHLIEACLLVEREKIKVVSSGKVLRLEDLIEVGLSFDKKFFLKYLVYKDLRNRGIPVRIAGKAGDFFVYSRGDKPSKHRAPKWLVFVFTENEPCKLDALEKCTRLGRNSRVNVLWAIVDGDSDITYYSISEKELP